MARQDQAQAQKQNTISYSESLELVRCLLRVSVFHISYLRGLFPDEYFKGVDMHNLDGMNIKMLMPACEESRRLIDWVEGGVYDAIRRGYLKGLYFGIALDPDGTSLLEEYIFNFEYAEDDGQVTMNVVQTNGRTGIKKSVHTASKGQSGTSVETVKYQVTRLMRMLVQICQTLDKVPHERYLFMKLTYHGHAPDDYEPPYFVPVEGGAAVGHFARKPFTMEVGKVSTNHHGLVMKVKSTLDCCDGGDESVGEPEDVASGGMDKTADMADNDQDIAYKNPTALAAASDHHGQRNSSATTEVPVQSYGPVKAYVVRCLECDGRVEFTDALTVFLDVSPAELEKVFTSLKKDCMIQSVDDKPGSFTSGAKYVQEHEAKQREQEADKLANDMKGQLAVKAQNKKGADKSKAAKADDTVQMVMPSQEALAFAQGSEMTGNGVAKGNAATVAAGDGDAAANVHFEDGVRSGAGKTNRPQRRKASYVADPIHQQPQKAGKRARRGV